MEKLIELCLSDNYEQLEECVQEKKIDLSKRSNVTGRTMFEVLAINERISNCLSSLMLLRRLGALPLPVANSKEILEDLAYLKTPLEMGEIPGLGRLAYSLAIKNIKESKNVPLERVIALMIMSDQKIVPKQLKKFATQEQVDKLLLSLAPEKLPLRRNLLAFSMSSKEKRSDEKKGSSIKNGFWRNPIRDDKVLGIVKEFITSDTERLSSNYFCLPRFAAIYPAEWNDSKLIKVAVICDNEKIKINFFRALGLDIKNDTVYITSGSVLGFKKIVNDINFKFYSQPQTADHTPVVPASYKGANIVLFIGKNPNMKSSIEKRRTFDRSERDRSSKLLRVNLNENSTEESQIIQLENVIFGRDMSSKFNLDILPRTREITLLDQLLFKLHSAAVTHKEAMNREAVERFRMLARL